MSDRLDAIAADDALLDSLALGHAVAAPADRDLVGLLGALRAAVCGATVDGYEVRVVDPVQTQLAMLRREALASLDGADPDATAVERAGRMARRVPAWLAAGGLVVGSVSGVAAAVSGDPFRPYQSVVHHVVQQIQNAAPHFGSAAHQQFVLGQHLTSSVTATDRQLGHGRDGQHGLLGHHHLRRDDGDTRTGDSANRQAIVSDERRGDGYRPRAVVRRPVRPREVPQRITAEPVPTASPVIASPMPTRTAPDRTGQPVLRPQIATDHAVDTPNSTSDTATDAPPKANEPSNPYAPKTSDNRQATKDPSGQPTPSSQSTSTGNESTGTTGTQSSSHSSQSTSPSSSAPVQKSDTRSDPSTTTPSTPTTSPESTTSHPAATGHADATKSGTARQSTKQTAKQTGKQTAKHTSKQTAKHRAERSARTVGRPATRGVASVAKHAVDRATGVVPASTDG